MRRPCILTFMGNMGGGGLILQMSSHFTCRYTLFAVRVFTGLMALCLIGDLWNNTNLQKFSSTSKMSNLPADMSNVAFDLLL